MPGLSLFYHQHAQTLFSSFLVFSQSCRAKAPGTVFQSKRDKKEQRKRSFRCLFSCSGLSPSLLRGPFCPEPKSVFSFGKQSDKSVFSDLSLGVRSQQSKRDTFLQFPKETFLMGDPVTNAIRGYVFLKLLPENISCRKTTFLVRTPFLVRLTLASRLG